MGIDVGPSACGITRISCKPCSRDLIWEPFKVSELFLDPVFTFRIDVGSPKPVGGITFTGGQVTCTLLSLSVPIPSL